MPASSEIFLFAEFRLARAGGYDRRARGSSCARQRERLPARSSCRCCCLASRSTLRRQLFLDPANAARPVQRRNLGALWRIDQRLSRRKFCASREWNVRQDASHAWPTIARAHCNGTWRSTRRCDFDRLNSGNLAAADLAQGELGGHPCIGEVLVGDVSDSKWLTCLAPSLAL
jgi:hypothetical protein